MYWEMTGGGKLLMTATRLEHKSQVTFFQPHWKVTLGGRCPSQGESDAQRK